MSRFVLPEEPHQIERENCGQAVILNAPVYPDSVLLMEDNDEAYPNFGSLVYTYATDASVYEVGNFYHEYSICPQPDSSNSSETLFCTGNIKLFENAGIYTYYRATVKEENAQTSYELFVQWHCGLLD